MKPFVAGTLVGVAVVHGYQWFVQWKKTKRKIKKIGDGILPASAGTSPTTGTSETDQELMQEQLSRIESFFGTKSFQNVKDAFVIVVGLGGVGSHAAHMLARSGVRKLRLIDFDNVTLSSLNRHALATRSDVGLSKVEATKAHLLEIVPHCEIEAISLMFEAEAADELLAGHPTYVLDCIDDVKTKTDLLAAASDKKLKLMTSTGAGAKADPTRICIAKLSEVTRDPLAAKIRYFLKKRNIDASSIQAIYSTEKSRCKLLPLEQNQVSDPGAYGAVENFRVRVMPVLGTMPALFGQSMAAYVLADIAGQPIRPESVARLSKDQRNKFYNKLLERERKLAGSTFRGRLPIDKTDIEFIVTELWENRSAVSGVRFGQCYEGLFLVRWFSDRPISPSNAVLLTSQEVEAFDARGADAFDADCVSNIEARLDSCGSWE